MPVKAKKKKKAL